MNKEEFITVLEFALLSFDGADISKYELNTRLIKMGDKLAKYLKEFVL
jgi:hypothetical protein